jgi:hypothetical protein
MPDTPQTPVAPPLPPARGLRLTVAVFAGTVALWVLVPLLVWWTFPLAAPTEMATFGDSFGVVSSLFSALAMGGVILSLHLQRKDFELAHAEMRTSAQAQKTTADAQVELAQSQKAAQEALRDLLLRQTEALDALRHETALTRLRDRFTERFVLWQQVRAQCGGDGVDCRQHFAARLVLDKDLNRYSCADARKKPAAGPNGDPADHAASLPYDLMGTDYMAQFKNLVLITHDPVFQQLPDSEQADFRLRLRSVLTEAEKIALAHLFPSEAPEKGKLPVLDLTKEQDRLLIGLARLRALMGVSELQSAFQPQWKCYRALVTGVPDPSDPLVASAPDAR